MRSTKSENAVKWGLRAHAIAYAIGIPAQIVVWWTVTPEHFFWPLWPALGWGVGLACHAWAVSSTSRAGN
ncbi:2TM domain-containing protein [Actinocorallia aurea]